MRPVLPLVNTPSRLCRMLWWSQAVQFWPWLGDSFPFQHLAERFLFSLCQRPWHARNVWRNLSGKKTAHRDIDIQWYSHSIDLQWYSHSLFMSVPYIFPTSMASMAIDLSGCWLDYWLIGSCPAIANEAISWNGTEGRLLRLFLLFSILDTVGLM